jgi:hypothetical protein
MTFYWGSSCPLSEAQGQTLFSVHPSIEYAFQNLVYIPVGRSEAASARSIWQQHHSRILACQLLSFGSGREPDGESAGEERVVNEIEVQQLFGKRVFDQVCRRSACHTLR